jgi:protein TonB
MTTSAIRNDLVLCRRTERRTMAASVAAHALLFALLLRIDPNPIEQERLTEVSLLEGEAAAPPAAAAPAAAAVETQPGLLRVRSEESQFRRRDDVATRAPDRQTDAVFEDRLSERLATLQRTAPAPVMGLATMAPPASQVALAGLPDAAGSSRTAPVALNRSSTSDGGSAPLALARGAAGSDVPNLALAGLPQESKGARRVAAPAHTGARSSLAGISLAGPIADRPVLESVRPEYPEWAKSEAIEGSVTLYFTVSPDGQVLEGVLVQKTAGFQDFDDGAVTALRAWRFAPLPPGRMGDQWGTITFHFKLAGAR